MNERIHELMELASETATTYYAGRGNITETYFDKRKFARLVIEHCISIVEPSEHHRAYANDYIAGVEGLDLLDAVTVRLKRLIHE